MKTNTETYKVVISGEELHLVSDESREHVLQAAQKVDAIVQQLSQGAGSIDKRRLSILAAVQLASELLHTQKDLESRKQKEDALASLIDRTVASL